MNPRPNFRPAVMMRQVPQAAKLAMQSSAVYGAVTLGMVILAGRVYDSVVAGRSATAAGGGNAEPAQAPVRAAPAPARIHAYRDAFEEGLVAFNTFSLSSH